MTVTEGLSEPAIGKSPKLTKARSVRPSSCNVGMISREVRELDEKTAVGGSDAVTACANS